MDTAQVVARFEADPFNPLYHGLHGRVLYAARRFDEAIAAADAGLKLQPGHRIAHTALLRSLFAKGMLDQVLAHQREAIAQDREGLAAFEQGQREGGYEGAQRRLAALWAGRYEEARRAPADGAAAFWLPKTIAERYSEAGDYDQAIRWHEEEAYRVRDPNLPYIGPALPVHDPLRADPLFQDLLRRMKLPLK